MAGIGDYRENFRENVRALRLKQRLTQRELGARVYRDRRSISLIEQTGNFPAAELPMLAQALGVTPASDLLEKRFDLT